MVKIKYASKRERFLKVAEARTQAVIQRIKILNNCSNKNLYEYSQDEVDRIFKAIQDQINQAKANFVTKKSQKFKL